jgi:hypothetical protein
VVDFGLKTLGLIVRGSPLKNLLLVDVVFGGEK